MRELAVRETDDEYARLWRPDRDERTLFVTHLTADSATRYQFDILGSEENLCVFSKGDNITPPRVVVELLNEEGYEVQNLPNVSEEDPALRAQQIIDAIEWLGKHGGLEPGDLRQFAYQRAQNVMPVVYGSALIMDIIGEERYTNNVEALLEDASQHGRTITADELLDPRTHDIEFLQTLLIELRKSLPMDEQEQVAALAEERLGISPSDDGSESPEAQTWESTTYGEAQLQLNPDAYEALKEQGWLDESDFQP